MSDGWLAVIGTAVGAGGSLATTWLNAHLAKAKADPVAEARKKLLLAMLKDKRYESRSLSTLAHVIGASEDVTKGLLLEVGARASQAGLPNWALVSKQPLPGEDVL